MKPRIDHYRAVSHEIMEILASTGAPLEQVSIDEAYLDLSNLCQGADADNSLQLAVPFAQQLKALIHSELNLTSSVGIGANKMLSKLGSDLQKPNGLTVILESQKLAILRPLPARKLYGVGEVTEQLLRQAGIKTIGDLQDFKGDLEPLVGSSAARLINFAHGVDDRPLELDSEPKSFGAEETFLVDTENQKVIMDCFWNQATELEAHLRESKKEAYTVQVKVRYSDFSTLTRQTTREDPVDEAKDIYAAGYLLLQRHQLIGRPLRLLGLEVHNLRELGDRQLFLL